MKIFDSASVPNVFLLIAPEGIEINLFVGLSRPMFYS